MTRTPEDIKALRDAQMHDVRAAWCEAFVKAQHGLINPPKTQRVNTGKFSYSYASLPDIIDSVRTVLAEQGLAVAQSVEAGASGYVGVTTTIYHSAGHSETFGPLLMPAGSTPQEAGSAITYARRYSLCAALNLAADEDDDGAKASQRPSAGVAGKGKVSAPAEGTTSTGQAQGVVAGSVDAPQHPVEDVLTAGPSGSPPSQDDPEVPARGACLHLLGSETVKRSGGDSVEVCKKCRRVLEDVRT